MSLYAAQSGLETNYEFRQRVRACVVQETGAWTEPPAATTDEIVDAIMPKVAASPGFAAQYQWGDQVAGTPPGHLAIEDSEILATVQPLLEDFRPA